MTSYKIPFRRRYSKDESIGNGLIFGIFRPKDSHMIEKKEGLSKMYKIGILGYGGFGHFLHTKWTELSNIHVSAVCDLRTDISVNDTQVYNDIKAFMNTDVDVISIVTPPSTHVDLALEAIAAGKHVLIDKPMALTTEGVTEILEAARNKGVRVSTNYMLRFNPFVQGLKRIIDQQLLGKLLHVSVINIAQDESLSEDHWFWNKEVSGGILIEHAVHFFDMIYYITGQPAIDVDGFSSYRETRQEDRVLGIVKHRDGLLATHFHAFSRPGFIENTTVRFDFEFGELELVGWMPLKGIYRGLINNDLEKELLKFASIESREIEPLEKIQDESRPEGWGETGAKSKYINALKKYTGHGTLTTSLRRGKSEVYGDCVKMSLLDLIGAIEGTDAAVISEDALYESLSVACKATGRAEGRR